jgi:O-antigen/teichoic acid export membrane protein
MSYFLDKINNRPIFIKAVKGFSLVALERFGRIGLNIISQFFIAKYLGPERYGQVSVPIKFIGLFMTLAVFGLDELIIRELVHLNDENDQISFIKSSLIIRFILALVAGSLAITCAYFFFGFHSDNFKYISLCSSIYLFYPFFTLELFFQKSINFKIAFRSKFISSLAVTLSRIIGAFKNLSIWFFLIVNIAEYFFLAILFILSFGSMNKVLIRVKPNFSLIKKILREGAPLALATFLVLVEQRYSLVLLQKYKTAKDLGLFSLSLTAMDTLQYLPMALGIATFPILVQLYHQSKSSFNLRINNVLGIITTINLIGLSAGLLFGDFLVKIVFGNKYEGLGTLINWIFVASFFYNANVIRIRWLVILGQLKIWLIFTMVSLIFSITLQRVLIAQYGVKGIFYAWIAGQFLANVLVSIFSKEFRITFIALINSPVFGLKYVIKIFHENK